MKLASIRLVPCAAIFALLGCAESAPPPKTITTTTMTSPTPPTPPAPATVTSAQVHRSNASGDAIPGVIQIVRSMRPAVERCFEQGASAPKLGQSLLIDVRVNLRGEVTHATPSERMVATVKDPAVIDCVLNRVRQAKFEPPGQAESMIEISIPYEPASEP